MIIKETDIYDITENNVDINKVEMLDNILNNVGPLFESEIQANIEGLSELKEAKKTIERRLLEIKDQLQILQLEFGRETKRKKLLNRIRQLIEAGLLNDPSFKSEIIILLKVIDKLEDDLLDEHIERMIKTISKRFSRNI